MGSTEVANQPQWLKSVDVQYNFELREQIRVEVLGHSDSSGSKTVLIGCMDFTLHEVVTQAGQTLRSQLNTQQLTSSSPALISVHAEEIKPQAVYSSDELIITAEAQLSQESKNQIVFFLVMR